MINYLYYFFLGGGGRSLRETGLLYGHIKHFLTGVTKGSTERI